VKNESLLLHYWKLLELFLLERNWWKENSVHYRTDNFQIVGTFSQEKAVLIQLRDLKMVLSDFGTEMCNH